MKNPARLILAAFTITLIMEASALCQTQLAGSSQSGQGKQESEAVKESSKEDERTVGPEKKLQSPVISFAGATIKLNNDALASPDKNVLALGKTAQPQAPSASSQSPQAAPAGGADEHADLAKKLANPIASLISLPFQMNWDAGVGPDKHIRDTLNIQPVMPFKLNENWNLITRLIMPVVSQPPLVPGGETKFGLSDFLLSFFISPAKSKIVWGVGPAILIPVTSEPALGTEKLAIGPTVVVLKQTGGWTVGVLANHVWSVAGDDHRSAVNQTFIQPFLSYTTKTAWTYSLNSETAINWKARSGEEVTAPIHLQVTKLLRLGQQPISLGPAVGYYVDQPTNGPHWKARFVLTFLFPVGK